MKRIIELTERLKVTVENEDVGIHKLDWRNPQDDSKFDSIWLTKEQIIALADEIKKMDGEDNA